MITWHLKVSRCNIIDITFPNPGISDTESNVSAFIDDLETKYLAT